MVRTIYVVFTNIRLSDPQVRNRVSRIYFKYVFIKDFILFMFLE